MNEFRKLSFNEFNQLVYEIKKQMVMILNNMKIKSDEEIETKEQVQNLDLEAKKLEEIKFAQNLEKNINIVMEETQGK